MSLDLWNNPLLSLEDRLKIACAEIEMLKPDAMRYRHLVKAGLFRAGSLDMSGNHTWVACGRSVGRGPTLPQAIDNSIAERE